MTMTKSNTIDASRLRQLRDSLQAGLVERDLPVRLALLSILAGEHTLLLGPPGTAKSLVARRLHRAVKDGRYFERLLTRFSVPEELFGPLSLHALEQDRYERQIQGYLPTASIAFLDEIFKANSAILNSMLTLLNEREFDNGTRRERTPLVGVVAASNELPEGPELDALLDRFLVRVHVPPVSHENFTALLAPTTGNAPMPADDLQLDAMTLQAVKDAATLVNLPPEVLAMLADLRTWCAAEAIPVSDRRWRQIAHLLKTSAATNGRDAVSIWDGWLVQHCVWSRPEDREKVAQWFAQRVAASGEERPGNVTRLIVALERRLARDRSNLSQKRDGQGRLVFLDENGGEFAGTRKRQATRDGKPLYLAPSETVVFDAFRHPMRLADRTNAGSGYTLEELNELWLNFPDRKVQFSGWVRRNNYIDEIPNQLMTDDVDRPVMIPSPQTRAHVDGLLADVARIEGQVELYRIALETHRQSLDDQILSHLWVTQDFLTVARSSLGRSAEAMTALRTRVKALREGVEALPIEAPLQLDEDDATEEVDA